VAYTHLTMRPALALSAPESGPLSLRDLDALTKLLPAEQRAAARWARPELEAALRRLQQEPLLPHVVADATKRGLRALANLAPALRSLTDQQVRMTLESAWRDQREKLRALLADDEAAVDAAEWAFRSTVAVRDWAAASLGARGSVPSRMQAGDAEDEADAFARTEFLLGALFDLAEQGGDRRRAVELAERAFAEACRGLDTLALGGVRIDPFRGETADERAHRLERYADHLRGSLSEEDMQTLQQSRLVSLR